MRYAALAAVLGRWLVSFCIVDEHIHLQIVCSEHELPHRVQSFSLALRNLTEVEIERPWVRKVQGHSHVENLIGYSVHQPVHHGVVGHPALWPGSCFVDLIGARVLPGLELRVKDVAPRHRIERAYLKAGLPRPLDPMSLGRLRELGAFRMRDAVLQALGISNLHVQQGRSINAARTVMVHLGSQAGMAQADIENAAGITARTRRRHRHKPADTRLQRAVLLRLVLEEFAARR